MDNNQVSAVPHQQAANAASSELCWYCKRNPADQRFAASIPMYNVTGGEYKSYGTVGVNRIDFQRIAVTVPRCESCQGRQRILSTVTRVLQILFFLVGLIILAIAVGYATHWITTGFGDKDLQYGGLLGVIGFVVWVISWNTQTLSNIILTAISPIKPEFYGSKSPNVETMLKNRWKVGKKPMD